MSTATGTSAVTFPTGRRRTLTLLIVLLAAFMDLLDATIATIALPAIRTDLGASPAQLEWVLAGYTLAFALGVVTGARLGDLYGYKRVFLIGMAGFTAASALCGAAPSPDLLVAARVLQGVFGAAMIPQVLSQIQLLYAPHERGGAMAAFSSLSSLAAALGPILGALLLQADWLGLAWRSVFWINVPVGVLAVLAAARILPEGRSTGRPRLDLPGVALSGVGLLLILHPLTVASDRGHWPTWAYASCVLGSAVLVVFLRYQQRLSQQARSPLVEVSLFRIRSVAGGLLTEFLIFLPMMGLFFTLLQLLQSALGMSPLTVGVLMLAWPVANAAFATLGTTVLLPRIGRATVQTGLAVMATGMAVLAVTSQTATPATHWSAFVPGVFIAGAGAGLAVAPLAQLTLQEVPAEHVGSGSGLFNTVVQVAASIGVALFGTLYFNGLTDPTRQAAQDAGPAFATTMWISAALLTAAFAVSRLLPRTTGRRPANR
ncbi:DHA2 family efflux MFS transporter permease subunit [Streptomyces sp. MUM 203J]|uniref:DHA2 family efflux MFS transporter permease subunit n=1 Tax=Streptomyces sp. MUM 203J TaxID=2791990 RepID=UPI001F03E342|nr:DHA2 family efflux MFS transporter permease subunit [Streptomyces sp. MUM 203J]MCH0543279.1 DHA2 family efflux MFS transporter permease subunit [Streptomyces sp. MUM 203J]